MYSSPCSFPRNTRVRTWKQLPIRPQTTHQAAAAAAATRDRYSIRPAFPFDPSSTACAGVQPGETTNEDSDAAPPASCREGRRHLKSNSQGKLKNYQRRLTTVPDRTPDRASYRRRRRRHHRAHPVMTYAGLFADVARTYVAKYCGRTDCRSDRSIGRRLEWSVGRSFSWWAGWSV